MGLRNLEAEIHLCKTEYLESHQINISIVSTLQPTGYHALMASINIALIDIATGVNSKVIFQNLETCRYHMKTFSEFKTSSALEQSLLLLSLDLVTADFNLREGNHIAANALFSVCLASPQIGLLMEMMFVVLERLADLSSEMNNVQNTLRWAGIFLSLGLSVKNQLAIMKAFLCLAQISVAEGDDETALSLFNVALEGFTFMDVHRWRADCMVRIADIYGKRGEHLKSIELWKQARLLFERSSQSTSITRIDVRLAEASLAVSDKDNIWLEQLANTPAGEPDKANIVEIDHEDSVGKEVREWL
jgi:hypothetical protein